MKSRSFIAGAVLAALVAGILWQFARAGPSVRSARPVEGEAIIKEAMIGLIQHAYPTGDAWDLARHYAPSSSADAVAVTKKGKPCEVINACDPNFRSDSGLSWTAIGSAGKGPAEPSGILGSLKNWRFQRGLNRAMVALAQRQSPTLPAVESADSLLIDQCVPSKDSSRKNSCSAPAIAASLAFVKIVSDCGDLCGATSLIALERRDGAWVAIAVSLLAQE
jgi:hypothetical protein